MGSGFAARRSGQGAADDAGGEAGDVEVDQQADGQVGEAQVGHELSFVDRLELLHRLAACMASRVRNC